MSSLLNFLRRLRCQISDAARISPAARELAAWSAYGKSFIARSPERKLALLALAYRRCQSRLLRSRLERALRPWLETQRASIWRDKQIGWARFNRQLKTEKLNKSLILKPPLPNGEKGVLYLSFEYNWLRLLRHARWEKLLDEYLLVGASSWSPPDFSSLWALARVGPDPVFIQISNPADVELYQQFQHNIRPVPIMACDWINPDFYKPRPRPQREIDLLMVANWSPIKRHWLLFHALRKMPRSLRVVLIGQDADGRTADDVFAEAKAFGVSDRIELVRDATIESVTEFQCNSKASVILSAREGSCVVTVESLFADTPVAMMHDAHVGSKSYINAHTGILMRPATIARQLSELIEHAENWSPRAWALQNVTCFHSTKKLNAILRAYCSERQLPWTRDLVPFCWRPDPKYLRPSDDVELQPAYRNLHEHFGIAVAAHSVEPQREIAALNCRQ